MSYAPGNLTNGPGVPRRRLAPYQANYIHKLTATGAIDFDMRAVDVELSDVEIMHDSIDHLHTKQIFPRRGRLRNRKICLEHHQHGRIRDSQGTLHRPLY